MLEARDISFSYPGRRVLGGVSFSVAPGETVCVAGGNGAGKTTLLRILATLAVPDAGRIVFDGQDALIHQLRYRRQLGYMQEAPALYEEMTVKEYLVYRARLKGEPEKRIRRRIFEACEECGLAGIVKSPIAPLSAGQKKCVALADAVLLRPRVLLLDDFLAGMDRESRRRAGAILAAAASFSCVVATGHEIADLAAFAKRFLVLKGGTIAADIRADGIDGAEVARRVDAVLAGGCR